jgi:16S rRNA G527 N7-methylase RsmG
MRLRIVRSISMGILALGFGNASVFAADAADTAERQTKEHYKAAVTRADADYKQAKAHCAPLSGNEKHVCYKDAKAAYTRAKADAKAARKTGDAVSEATEDKVAANYKAAKERCDALSGDAKDACIADAKAKYKQ